MDALVRIYGKPAYIVPDNGTEFTSKAILKWANDNNVEWHYIDPGKPSRTVTSSHSTAACVTNASTRRSLTAWQTPAARWPSGATITTMSGPTHRWETNPQQKRAGRLNYLKPPHPTRLPHPKPPNIKPKDSRYERGTTGGQVRPHARNPTFSDLGGKHRPEPVPPEPHRFVADL